jgi:hypothetical protein
VLFSFVIFVVSLRVGLSACTFIGRKSAQEQNTNGKHADCDHVKRRQKKSSEAESFKQMNIKYPIHLTMAM